MAEDSPLVLVALKAFGDFVIARWALRHSGVTVPIFGLVMGEHLVELNTALGNGAPGHVIRHGEGRLPALFDIKKTSLGQGLVSALRIRRLLRELALPQDATLVFDQIGVRERFIASPLQIRSLPDSNNVYMAYASLLGVAASKLEVRHCNMPSTLLKVGIFPGSRIASKALPACVINNVASVCYECGYSVDIFFLEGEDCDPLSIHENIITVPRRFAAMVQAVQSVDVVISADSMPAHLAEYFDRSVFVVSSVTNTYWLPLSCFVGGKWSLFSSVNTQTSALRQFLEQLRS